MYPSFLKVQVFNPGGRGGPANQRVKVASAKFYENLVDGNNYIITGDPKTPKPFLFIYRGLLTTQSSPFVAFENSFDTLHYLRDLFVQVFYLLLPTSSYSEVLKSHDGCLADV